MTGPPMRRAARAVMALWMLAAAFPAAAQDAVWNLRTPEWKAVWPSLPNEEQARLDLIRVASQLVAYSGKFYPVHPVADVETAIPGGHVGVDVAWLAGAEEILAFGIARGWAHLALGHAPLPFATPGAEINAWRHGLRYVQEQEAVADAWSARFLAEFGYDAAPVLATLCAEPSGARRATALADAYEAVVGLRPPNACEAAPAGQDDEATIDLGTCEQHYQSCLLDMDAEVYACQNACAAADCALACGGGSYDQCNSCTASCGRRCNRGGVEVYELCVANRAICEANDDGI